MGLDLADFPAASPEVVWAVVNRSSKYIRGRIPAAGGDAHYHASSEPGNLSGFHLPRDTGNPIPPHSPPQWSHQLGLRHLVTFDLELGEEEGTILLTESEPHSHAPSSAKTVHTVAYTSGKTCYEDILKMTHEKRPDLDRAIGLKLKALLLVKATKKEEEE